MAGKTFAQKIFGRAYGRDVEPDEIVVLQPDYYMSHENTSGIIKSLKELGVGIWDKNRIVVIFDHTVPPSIPEYANTQKTTRDFLQEQDIPHFYDLNKCGGICHQIMCQEGFAAPGRLIVGTDSHTCTSGAMGAFAAGIGRTEMATVWATGEMWFMVPHSLKIVVDGSFAPGVTAKDLILKIIGDLGAAGADYLSVEFHGPSIEAMSIAERMTLCNMGVEMGAKAAVCKPDQKVFDILAQFPDRRAWEVVWADDDARYLSVSHYNLSELKPCVAAPFKVDNYATVESVSGTKIHQVFIGSCTNGRIEDLREVAKILKGGHVNVRTIISPASVAIYEQAIAEGLISIFLQAGCMISHPGCGPCFGAMGGVLGDDEICVSTTNRNFTARMGSKKSAVYIASPVTAACSALVGAVANDIAKSK